MKLIAKGLRLLNADKPTQNVASILWGPSGPVNSSTMDDKCAIAQRLADCHNALAGIPDPAAALKAAREALEWALSNLHEDAEAVFPKQVEFCHAALVALKGEQP